VRRGLYVALGDIVSIDANRVVLIATLRPHRRHILR
jgi:hypothetical protein